MKKLIELLNEREIGEKWWEFYYLSDGAIRDDWWNILYDYRIISKEFWFIEWLVDNDKIDLEKVQNKFYYDICLTDYWDTERAYWKSDLVISVLSISDNPIQDLLDLLV